MALENDLAGVNAEILETMTMTVTYNQQTEQYNQEIEMYSEKKRIAKETSIEQQRLEEEAYGRS